MLNIVTTVTLIHSVKYKVTNMRNKYAEEKYTRNIITYVLFY